jgi:hypothetical protein
MKKRAKQKQIADYTDFRDFQQPPPAYGMQGQARHEGFTSKRKKVKGFQISYLRFQN